MLTEEERRQIQAEELAAVRAAQALRQEGRREVARQAYRREVRSVLNPRARLMVAALCTLLLLAGVLVAIRSSRPDVPGRDDTSGGIATSALMQRCQTELEGKIGQSQLNQGQLHFPAQEQADAQITASPDGKRWDGSFLQNASGAEATQTDFSCIYTTATDEISTELITP
jgi:hypothetical protein